MVGTALFGLLSTFPGRPTFNSEPAPACQRSLELLRLAATLTADLRNVLRMPTKTESVHVLDGLYNWFHEIPESFAGD